MAPLLPSHSLISHLLLSVFLADPGVLEALELLLPHSSQTSGDSDSWRQCQWACSASLSDPLGHSLPGWEQAWGMGAYRSGYRTPPSSQSRTAEMMAAMGRERKAKNGREEKVPLNTEGKGGDAESRGRVFTWFRDLKKPLVAAPAMWSCLPQLGGSWEQRCHHPWGPGHCFHTPLYKNLNASVTTKDQGSSLGRKPALSRSLKSELKWNSPCYPW